MLKKSEVSINHCINNSISENFTYEHSLNKKKPIFAPDLVKGMLCKSATVPAAVSPCKVCQSSHCAAHPHGKATGSGESEDLPNR